MMIKFTAVRSSQQLLLWKSALPKQCVRSFCHTTITHHQRNDNDNQHFDDSIAMRLILNSNNNNHDNNIPAHELPLLNLSQQFENIPQMQLKKIQLTSDKNKMQLQFQNQSRSDEIICRELSSEFLRVYSPSAQVIGHDGKRRLVFGKKHVLISGIEKVGNYAIRITFSDGHDTGIYSFKYLWELSCFKYTLMKQYIRNLQKFNRSRYPGASRRTKLSNEI